TRGSRAGTAQSGSAARRRSIQSAVTPGKVASSARACALVWATCPTTGRMLALAGLAGDLQADAVGVVEIDAPHARQLLDRTVIGDAMCLEPRLIFGEAPLGDDEGAMLHRADGVARGRRLLALGDLEHREQAVIAHVEEIVAQILVGRIAAIARSGA